jgi:hypothetical protein
MELENNRGNAEAVENSGVGKIATRKLMKTKAVPCGTRKQ